MQKVIDPDPTRKRYAMIRRTITTATVAATALLLPAVAQAAAPTTPARLTGNFTVTMKVTQSYHGDALGSVFVRPMSFTPSCAAGTCASTLTRTRGDGISISYLVKPTTTGTYVGTKTYKGYCFRSGQPVVPNGFTYTEKTTIKQTRVTRGVISAFSGTLKLSFKPTAVGVANNCQAGNETMSLSGTR